MSTDTPSRRAPTDADRSAAAGLVLVQPPLPATCSSPGHVQPGFVHAIGADRLVVHSPEPWPDAPTARAGIARLAVDGGQTYALPFSSAAPLPTAVDQRGCAYELRLTDSVGLASLAELLTILRKSQHITICATMDVEASDRDSGFSDVRLRPCALPELAWSELDTRQEFLGRTFALPLLITGMTGGLARGAEINRRLARAAAAFGIPMGVGSQRVALDHPEHAAIFAVKADVPDVFLIGNVGIAQLLAKDAVAACTRAVTMIGADALALHVNVLQEIVQVEGDRDFRGILRRIADVAAQLPVPLLVKEVGSGIDLGTATALAEAGVKAIDCGGKGGTSWSLIEGIRAQSPVTQAVANTFRDWGIPTAPGVAALRLRLPAMPLVATGGIRDGLTVAKAVALGATMCGVGLPLFRAAVNSEHEPFTVLETLAQGLRTAMICSGAATLAALPGRLHLGPAFRELLTAQLQPQGLPPLGG